MPGIRSLPLLRPEAGRFGRAVIFLGVATINVPDRSRAELPSVHLKVDAVARAALVQHFPEPDDLAELHLLLSETPPRLEIQARLLDRAGKGLYWRRVVPRARLLVERTHVDEFVASVARDEGLVLIISQLDIPGVGPEAHPRTLYLSPHQVRLTSDRAASPET